MAAEEDSEQQYSLKISDSVLLYSKETSGYVFSELSSSQYNSVALFGVDSQKETRFPNVHFATFKIVAANKYKKQERYSELKKYFQERGPDELITEDEERSVMLVAKRALEDETRENEAEQERQVGTFIVYGDVIQLFHTLTKRFLYVSTTQTACTENANLRVELKEGNSLGCHFRILPRYKVRSVGDVVRYGDQIKFESVKTEGQFLHCSAVKFQKKLTVHANCYELNLSAAESAFSLIPHYRPQPSHPPEAFRAGKSVRLFHRECECYIVAEGSFAEDQPIVEDVHCRKRHSDHGILKAPSTSANTYWQFEKESDSRSGEPLSWGERCRIKHMPTRRYLAVVKPVTGDYRVTLREWDNPDFNQIDTVFILSPVIKEGDTVLLESYARIKHLHTGTWLHLQKDKSYKRVSCPPGLKGLEQDSAELFQLTASTSQSYDDAFTLEQVEEPLLDKFNYVTGIIPVLKTHIQEQKVPNTPLLVSWKRYAVESALKELAEFLVAPINSRDKKNCQKLLRNLRALELIIETLKLFSYDSKDVSEQRKVCQAGYLVIENYLKGDSRKNENYLARFINIFQQQVRMGLNAEEVMIEMVEDNIAIITKMAETEIDYVIKQLMETEDPRFMQFLSNLCVCSGRPIPQTQNAILEKLVLQHGEDVLYHTEVSRTEPNVINFKKPRSHDWRNLTEIASHDVTKRDDKNDLEYLKAQLHLFGRMCQGNNAKSISTLGEKYITFDEALLCARDGQLCPSIRSQYVELIRVMYVDVGDNRAILDNLSFSFLYIKVVEDPYAETGTDDETALTGVVNPYFPQMKVWIKDHLNQLAHQRKEVALETLPGVSSSPLIASCPEENKLLAQVLGVLSLLVKYGYYDDKDDVEDVMKPLISILDGTTDIPFPESSTGSAFNTPSKTVTDDQVASTPELQMYRQTGRFQCTVENQAIFTVKEKAMEIIDLFFNFRFYIRLQRFIFDFRLLKGDVDTVSDHELLVDTEKVGSSPPPELTVLQQKGTKIMELPMLVKLARERLQFIFAKSAYFFEEPEYTSDTDLPQFSDIMLDLANYDSDELVQGSLHLLNRCYSSEISLFSKAIQTELLITQRSERVFEAINGDLPELRRLLSIDGGESGRSRIIAILQTFADMCFINVEEQEAHTQNQKILYNFGILSDVLNYVLLHSKDVATTKLEADPDEPVYKGLGRRRSMHPSSYEAVIAACYKFFQAMACSNVEVQQRLYDRMSDLLEINVAMDCMSEMLTEVFTGGPEICLKVKEEQVQRIFEIIASGENTGSYELINTLQAMAMIETVDLPVERNQNFIIKYFSVTRSKFCDYLLGEGKKDVRMDTLHQELDEDSNLQLLLSMTDMLASCAEGENLFIESVCQTVFSINELLEILSDPSIPSGRKRPFARFLVSVYMNTAGDKNKSGAAELEDSSEMWAYLKHVAIFIQNFGRVLQAMPSTEYNNIRKKLSSGTKHHHVHSAAKRRWFRAIHTKTRAIPFVTGEDGELLPGVILYFSAGVLPLLRTYFAEFFDPQLMVTNRLQRLNITGTILSTLMRFSEVLTKYFTDSVHVKLYRGTVMTMLKNGQGEVPLDGNQQMVDNFDLSTSGWSEYLTQAKQDYQKHYTEEFDLNETFNTFVSNFQLAYQGPNTAREQIGANFDTTYSTFLDEEMKSPGDEYLPLGPSFQDHVRLFVNKKSDIPTPDVANNRGPTDSHPVKAEKIVTKSAERLLAQLNISFHKLENLEEAERHRQDELDIKCLQILRAIIHNEIMQIGPEDLKETDPARFRRRCAARLHPVQIRIQNFDNAVARVTPLLSHPNDDIVREVLAFLKALFYSGNRTVQQGMQHLLNTREEKLFVTMRLLLQNAAIIHRERKALKVQVEERAHQDSILRESVIDLYHAQKPGKPTPLSVRRTEDRKVSAPSVVVIDEDQQQQQNRQSDIVIEISMENDNGETIPMEPLEPVRLREHFDSLKSPSRGHRRRSSLRAVQDYLSTLGRGSTAPNWIEISSEDKQTAELLQLQDSSNIKLALRVLGLMCDGQYRLMQNYLREQPDNIHNINIVGEVALFLQMFSTDLNLDTLELVHLILQTLIEFCVGNFPNQEVIFKRQIIDAINSILDLSVSSCPQSSTEIRNMVNLKASAVELLETMLEETDKGSKALAKEIYLTVHIDALHNTLSLFHTMMNDPSVKMQGYDDEAERGLFRTYHILVHLADYPETCQLELLEPKAVEASAWQFCKERSKSIEVKYENMNQEKVLTKVHFQFDPRNKLREEVIEKVKWSVNRDSPEDKQRDFLDWMLAIKKDTIHHNWLHRHWLTHILISHPIWRYWILLFLSLLLNIFILATFTLPTPLIEDDRLSDRTNFTFHDASGAIAPDVAFWFGRVLLYILGIAHLFLSLWMVVEYFVVNYPNFVLPSWMTWLYHVLLSKLKSRFHKSKETNKEIDSETTMEPSSDKADINIFGLRTLYVVVFLLASAFSLGFYGYFYAFCLLHIIVNNDILQRVLQAVTKNGVALLWVAILGLVVIYIYAVVSFAFLHESFLAEEGEAGEGPLFCDTLFQCFISVIRYGLMDTLGLYIPLTPSQWETSGLRLLLDITFFIIVTTIGLNIVFGIIVDTFSELRDERFRTEQDKKSFCFICGLSSHEFERRCQGFDHHVEHDHNMWDYIYYSIYLDTIDISDHNAIESYVYRMIQDKKINFFPLLEARVLESEEDDADKRLEELKNSVDDVLMHFQEEEHRKSVMEKAQEQEKWEVQRGLRQIDFHTSFDTSLRSPSHGREL